MGARGLESRNERLNDALCLGRESPKLLQARLPHARLLSAKHYIAGVVYLGWKELILHPSGKRYEATLAVRRIKGPVENEFAFGKRQPDVKHCLGGNHDLVLVSYIEALDGEQRPIPSLMWLGLSHKAGRIITGTGAGNLLPNGTFEFREIANDGKIAAGGVGSTSMSASGNQMVERRSEIMDRIADDQRNIGRQGSAVADPIAVRLRHWVDFWPGQIGIAVEKAPEIGLEISDVAFRPLQL